MCLKFVLYDFMKYPRGQQQFMIHTVCVCLKFVIYDFMEYPIHDAVCVCLIFVLYDFIITTVITFIEIR